MSANETPPFWFRKPGAKAWALSPLAWLWGRGAALKMQARPAGEASAPVLCIGNFITGGGGKTPTALAIGAQAAEMGLKPGFLSRGYGGRMSGPAMVDPERHKAIDAGDEPMLLARIAPVAISPDRLAGARLLEEAGCDFIIMDDGFQNPRLRKDYSLVVTDARRGIGNGYSMPAGPLRLPLEIQLRHADAVLVIGREKEAAPVVRAAARRACPIFRGVLETRDAEQLKDKWLIAYSGIADPARFFASLRDAGAELAHAVGFGDHHYFTEDDVRELLDRARLMKAELVTTAKDHVRLAGAGKAQGKLARATRVIDVDLVFDDPDTPVRIIERTIARFDQRMLKARSLNGK